MFATDNNGVIIELPSISASGASNPSGGLLVFGIGTQSNNGLASATQVAAGGEFSLAVHTVPYLVEP